MIAEPTYRTDLCPRCDHPSDRDEKTITCQLCGTMNENGECVIHGCDCRYYPRSDLFCDDDNDDSCSNCIYHGFPCLNCAQNRYIGRHGPGFFHHDRICMEKPNTFACPQNKLIYENMIKWIEKNPSVLVWRFEDYDWPLY